MPGKDQDKASKNRRDSKDISLDISEGTSSTRDSSISMPPAPDGGYGWVIVLSAFFVMAISDGFALSFGVLFTELSEVFNASKSVTSIIASLFYGVPLVCGPIASIIINKLGSRKAQVIGGLITSAGILASAFVDSIGLMCFTFGFIAGFGLSIGYVNSAVIVAYYFEKKRSLATGLSVCGSGIGTFVFAPFLEFLIEEYGWRGSFVVLSAVTLNLVVCGAFMRPLEFTPTQKWRRNLKKFENMSKTLSISSLQDHSCHASSSDLMSGTAKRLPQKKQRSHSQEQLPTFTKKSRNIPVEMSNDSRKYGSKRKRSFQNFDSDDISRPKIFNSDTTTSNRPAKSDGHVVFADDVGSGTENIVRMRSKKKRSVHLRNSSTKTFTQYPLSRKDLLYRRSTRRFSVNPKLRRKSSPVLHQEIIDDSPDEEIVDCCSNQRLLKFPKFIKKLFKSMFDFQIIKIPSFFLFVLSNFIFYFWDDVPYVFLNDIAVEDGIENPAIIISTLGIVNTFGQIIYGFIGDRDIDLILLYGVSIGLSGLALMAVPWFQSLIPLCIFAGLFGFFISANYALDTVIVVEIVGIDKLANSYGLTMMMQGLANIIGPPVAGLLYDMSGSYDHTFIAGGVFIAFSGLILVFVPIGRCIKLLVTRKQSFSYTTPEW
ncbi:monocarboxylate transporter 9-like [Ostrea edulis]|uniref:monocarboxylate transporter 9-like n=1 Tax=Ostrea edulis TaxID=37623 RepID=UPI0024AF4B8A|nr:monocarboxylate transporter 9-like [Ostrea edulis]